MSGGRLYLVRRDSREFIGPMVLAELRQRLSRLEFGMQDEVSGHCGPWVVLDQKEILTLHYPEIAELLQDSLPLSWREVTNHARVISRQDARRDRSGRSRSTRRGGAKTTTEDFNAYLKQRRLRQKIVWASIIFVVSSLTALGVWMAGRGDDLPSLSEISTLANKSDNREFMDVMASRVIPAAARIAKSPKTMTVWIPYLRMYAFNSGGVIEGVSARQLRGDLPQGAPADCGVDFLKRKWRENAEQIVQFSQGRTLSKNPWTRILAMDPQWVRRRPAKGWIKPRNFYEACLMNGIAAIRSLAGEPDLGADPKDGLTPELLGLISRRLQAQLELLTVGQTNVPTDRSSVLGALTCLESSQKMGDIDACKNRSDPQFQALLDERVAMALLRMALSASSVKVDTEWMTAMQQVASKIMAEDVMSRSDLSPEGQIIGFLLMGMGVDQAINKTELDHQDVRFR
jgi:hypothetical protein